MATDLRTALNAFTNELSPPERKTLFRSGQPRADDVLRFTETLDVASSKGKCRALGHRFTPMLEAIQQFAGVIDTFMQGGPDMAAILWGGIKFVVTLLSNYTEYFEKVSDMFLKLGSLCPRLDSFQKIFPDSKGLQDAVCSFYAIVVRFCHKTIRFLRSSTLKQLAKAAWKPYKSEFREIEAALLDQREAITMEVQLASENAAQRERQEASLYRSQVKKHQLWEVKRWDNLDLRLDVYDEKKKKEALLDRMCSYDHVSEFLRIRERRDGDESTAQWFFDTEQFQNWSEPDTSSFLWCHGIPGSGKSVLTTSVLDHLFTCRQQDTFILYFFCTFASKESLDLRTLLQSLLKQTILIAEDSLPEKAFKRLRDLYSNPNRLPSLREVESALIEILKIPKEAYIVIDGVDECTSEVQEAFLHTFKRIHVGTTKTKFLVSSRTDLDLLRIVKNALEINLDLVEHRTDIEDFIDKRLEEKTEAGETMLLDDMLMEEVKSTLSKHARGMFLWVDLQIHDICRQLNQSDIRKLLKSLPRDLDKTFERILKRIIEEKLAPVAVKIFKWLSCARRPLTLDELAEAVALDFSDQHYHELQERLSQDKRKMIHNCGNLVVLRETDNTVHFAHFTVKEYLDRKSLKIQQSSNLSLFLLDLDSVDQEIGMACMAYMNFSDFQRQLALRQGMSAQTAIAKVGTSLNSNLGYWAPSVLTAGKGAALMWHAASYAYTALWGGSSSGKPVELPRHEPKVVERLVKQFLLLQYVADYWILHYNNIPAGTKPDEMFRSLVFGPGPPFPYLPWRNMGPANPNTREHPHTVVFRWAVLNEQVELIKFLFRDASASYMKTLFGARFLLPKDAASPGRFGVEARGTASDQMCEMRSLKLVEALGPYCFTAEYNSSSWEDMRRANRYLHEAVLSKDYAFANALRLKLVLMKDEPASDEVFLSLLGSQEQQGRLFQALWNGLAAEFPMRYSNRLTRERYIVWLDRAVTLKDKKALERLLDHDSYRFYQYLDDELTQCLSKFAWAMWWDISEEEVEIGRQLVEGGAGIGIVISEIIRLSGTDTEGHEGLIDVGARHSRKTRRPSARMSVSTKSRFSSITKSATATASLFGDDDSGSDIDSWDVTPVQRDPSPDDSLLPKKFFYKSALYFSLLVADGAQRQSALEEILSNYLVENKTFAKLIEAFKLSEVHQVLFGYLGKYSATSPKADVSSFGQSMQDLIGLFFKNGAGPNSVNEDGLSCIEQAIDWEVPDTVLRCLLAAGGDHEPLIRFFNTSQNWHVFKRYFTVGLLLKDAEGEFDGGQWFLHRAVELWRRAAMNESAIGSASSVRSANFEAMDGQFFGGQEHDIPQRFLDAKDSEGRTPLLFAVDLAVSTKFGGAMTLNNVDSHLIQALLDSGSPVDAEDLQGRSCMSVLTNYASEQEKLGDPRRHITVALMGNILGHMSAKDRGIWRKANRVDSGLGEDDATFIATGGEAIGWF